MFLRSTRLKNFRSFHDGEVEFQKDLTVLVGENNGGKSNAIDAIRLLTSPLNGRRELYCEPTDVRFQSDRTDFALEARFEDLSVGQQGRLISAATDSSLTRATFGLRYDGAKVGAKPTIWAGKEGNSPEPQCQDMIKHVYLPPLRDAKRALASGNPTRIMALLNHFLDGTDPADLAKDLARDKTHDVLTKVDTAVARGLIALTSGVRQQAASLGFATDETLVDIARDLRFKLADHGVNPEDLRYSGHGYANILFMAIIAVELEKARNTDLTIFLVEEPEAHLHPQLQASVLAFLRDQAEQSRTHPPSAHGPEGQLQVVVATHSPNLSAWVSSDRVVVFKSMSSPPNDEAEAELDPAAADVAVLEKTATAEEGGDGAKATAIAATVTAAALRRSTHCLPLAKLNLEPAERRKVDRYLDVTKAALLFGGRVLLVEGVAEALLLPVIAKCHTLKGTPEKHRLFQATVFVPIDGVDFAPYVALLLTGMNGARIAERVVVVTDGDKGLNAELDEDDSDKAPNADSTSNTIKQEASAPVEKAEELTHDNSGAIHATPGEKRKKKLEDLAGDLGASQLLAAIASTYSLESELVEAGNAAIMEKALLTIHPRAEKKWRDAVKLSGDARAAKIHAIFKDARKGDFAQVLAGLIEAGEPFNVPAYIAQAIEEVVAS